MKMQLFLVAILVCFLSWRGVSAYPLDGGPYTGIPRLGTAVPSGTRPGGAKLRLEQVEPRMLGRIGFSIPPPDQDFSDRIRRLLGDDADRYALAVLDLTDPDRPRYAEHQSESRFNPGSIGKLLIALGVFQTLADLYPDDIAARERLLRETLVTADAFILTDHHQVPIRDPASGRIRHRPLQVGDQASLWTYLDWMLSASSNAAASTVLRELMLLKHFGKSYPAPKAEREKFWQTTSKRDLSRLLGEVLQEPVPRNGLDPEQFRQGGFFTWKGKQVVPGTSSYATPRMLMQFLVRMERGQLVDVFSSRELKRLIYMTQRRIRYASSPALEEAAVYFKSGSLYRCQPEPGFECRKYRGNVENLLNSVAIVEYPAQERRLFYLVVVMSNVLKKNSAVEHQTLATRLQRLIEEVHRDGR